MAKKGRKFTRPYAIKRYRKLFLIASEGSKTEPCYFNWFQNSNNTIQIKCLKDRNGSPPPRLKKLIDQELIKFNLKHSDEAWVVVDKDYWTNKQLEELFQWSNQAGNYGLAVSNPKFEYWLLLHFEDGKGVNSPASCIRRLKRYINNYDKGCPDMDRISAGIEDAIRRAKLKDNPPCLQWPRTYNSTVYKLIENILESFGPGST